MRKLLGVVFAAMVVIGIIRCGTGGGNNSDDGKTEVTINAETDLSKGLDLKALGELLKKTKDPKTLEEELNKPGSINNVDLDGDGKVDYLKVTEYGDGDEHGLSITDDVKQGETQEIATVQIKKDGASQGTMDVQGNQDIYGPSANYQTGFSFGDFLLMSYIFAPHPFYASPWGWGYYPSYYMRPAIVPFGMYRSRMQTYTGTSTFRHSTEPMHSDIHSPNAGKSSATAMSRSALSPEHSAKSFGARDPGKRVGSGGFGHSGSGSSRGFGSSHRSFGGGRGFGRRR